MRDSSSGWPILMVTRGGCRTRVKAGVRAERAHTFSGPQSPTGMTIAPVAAASRAVPVLPFNAGSKNASPRGIVPCGNTITTSPARSAASAARSG